MQKSKTIDMTIGRPASQMLKFFFPLFIGNLFQQFYGIVDSLFISRYEGTMAFAAVGSSMLLVNFLTSILIGLSLGASAIFSQLFGGRNYQKLKETISTSAYFIGAVSFILAVSTFILRRPLLRLFQMPEELIGYASEYLIYIFAGLFFTGIYNLASFTIRSLGDSKTPVYILVTACLTNIVLDAFFMIPLKMGVAGAGLATLIAQVLSAVLALKAAVKQTDFLRWEKSDFRIKRSELPKIVQYSTLTAVQQSISSFGMMLVQGIVNTLGSSAIAAFAACSKIDEFANRPLQDLGNASATFTAQNHGAEEHDRIRHGFRTTLLLILAVSVPISLIAFFFAPNLINIFISNPTEEILSKGVTYLRILGPAYFFIGLTVTLYGYFRSINEISYSILITILSQGIRVVLSYLLTRTVLGFTAVAWAVIMGWIVSDSVGLFLYTKLQRKTKRRITATGEVPV